MPFEVIHVTEFLEDLIKQGKVKWEKPINKTVTYHDPCHLGRHVGVFVAPRYVLSHIPGVKFVEMDRIKEFQRCCGAGGGIKAGLPDLAIGISQSRVKDALATDANILSSACPFCKRNLMDGRDSLKVNIDVEDVIELVTKALGLSVEYSKVRLKAGLFQLSFFNSFVLSFCGISYERLSPIPNIRARSSGDVE